VGTRFQASADALVEAEVVKAILEGRGEETEGSECSTSLGSRNGHLDTQVERSGMNSSSSGAIEKRSWLAARK